MEEIIGLLVALAAIIFKVVGKRLEKSGAPASGIPEDSPEEPAGNPFDVKKWIEEVTKELEVNAPEVNDVPVAEPVPVKEVPKPKPFIEEAPRAVVKPAPKVNIMKEDAPEVKEKIDPKKLVVYSEIMKPKFKEEN
jgi:hypothetical protein